LLVAERRGMRFGQHHCKSPAVLSPVDCVLCEGNAWSTPNSRPASTLYMSLRGGYSRQQARQHTCPPREATACSTPNGMLASAPYAPSLHGHCLLYSKQQARQRVARALLARPLLALLQTAGSPARRTCLDSAELLHRSHLTLRPPCSLPSTLYVRLQSHPRAPCTPALCASLHLQAARD